MACGQPMPELTLTTDERETLERWARRPTTAQALAREFRKFLELSMPACPQPWTCT